MPTIRPAVWSDWDCFRHWAENEGWRILPYERNLVFDHSRAASSVLLDDDTLAGFITTWQHNHSGWIGNLLIEPSHRRRGFGVLLFERALQRLLKNGTRTVWLTASAMGRPIYEKFGFVRVNGIKRWIRSGTGTADATADPPTINPLLDADSRAWGDDRSALLLRLSPHAKILRQGWSLAMLQDAGGFHFAGPWLSASADPDELLPLLTALLAQTPASSELVIDVLEHSPLNSLLERQGFQPGGSNELMACGPTDAVRFDQIVALASLGSLG